MSHGFSPEALESWGWRVPFLLGLVIGPVGYVLRTRVIPASVHGHSLSSLYLRLHSSSVAALLMLTTVSGHLACCSLLTCRWRGLPVFHWAALDSAKATGSARHANPKR